VRPSIINLGNNHTVTLVEMIRKLEEALGIPAQNRGVTPPG